ncbi:hypothetical protein F5B18DRAFT_475451 [Nemania serpens]|nr:hypothetical protein F5B18DRAFT_475451 [Nemania serpens]
MGDTCGHSRSSGKAFLGFFHFSFCLAAMAISLFPKLQQYAPHTKVLDELFARCRGASGREESESDRCNHKQDGSSSRQTDVHSTIAKGKKVFSFLHERHRMTMATKKTLRWLTLLQAEYACDGSLEYYQHCSGT